MSRFGDRLSETCRPRILTVGEIYNEGHLFFISTFETEFLVNYMADTPFKLCMQNLETLLE